MPLYTSPSSPPTPTPTDGRRSRRSCRALWPWLIACCLSRGGCGGDASASRAAQSADESGRPILDPAETAAFSPAQNAEIRGQQLVQLARSVVANYQPLDRQWAGSLAKGQAQDHMLLLRYGRCYRILAVAGVGVQDLDLALYDRDQVERLRDLSSDRYPTLGLSPSLCPPRSDTYRLEVRAYEGAGEYTVGVWESPL